jgi:hypothetical protein
MIRRSPYGERNVWSQPTVFARYGSKYRSRGSRGVLQRFALELGRPGI